MAINVSAEFRDKTAHITTIDYPDIPDADTEWKIEDGQRLPNGPGFYDVYSHHTVSKNIYTAMMEGGMKDFADMILSHKTRSIITPNYIWKEIGKYAKKPASAETLNMSIYSACLKKLRNTLKVDEKLKPLSLDDACDVIPQRVSAGLPYIYFNSGAKSGDTVKRFYPEIKKKWHEIGQGYLHSLPDTVVSGISKIAKPGFNACRLKWNSPLIVMLQEARFSYPLMQAIMNQKCCLNTAHGCEIMHGGMKWINRQGKKANLLHGKCKYFLFEYCDFESTVPAWLIHDVLMIILEKFKCSEYDQVCYLRFVNYLIKTPIQLSDGRRFLKAHGIPSWMLFSNLIVTLTSMMISWYCCWSVFGVKPIFDMYYYDFGLICLPSTNLDINAYSRAMKYYFGIIISPTKSYWTSCLNNIRFMGFYNYYGTAYKEPRGLIEKMLHPCKWKTDKWCSTIMDTLDILLASTGVSVDVFLACRSVYIKAKQCGVNIQEGLQLLKYYPRTHPLLIKVALKNEKCDQYFTDIKMNLPSLDCLKIQLEISLV